VFVGPIAGPNYSWVSFDDKDLRDEYNVKPVFGFHAGVAASFQVRKRFFLTTSLLYSTKGKIITGNSDPLLNNKVRYQYISMPIVYTVDFRSTVGNKVFKWYLGAGPNINYWLGGKGTFINSPVAELSPDPIAYSVVFRKSPEEINDTEMTVEDPNRIQLGLNIVSGFAFEPNQYQKILLLLRYELGHSFFSRTSNGLFASTFYEDVMQVRNQGFRLSVSYLFDLKIQERKRGKSTIKKKKI